MNFVFITLGVENKKFNSKLHNFLRQVVGAKRFTFEVSSIENIIEIFVTTTTTTQFRRNLTILYKNKNIASNIINAKHEHNANEKQKLNGKTKSITQFDYVI